MIDLKCILIFNGYIKDWRPIKRFIKDDDFLICTDGALNLCHKFKIKPNLIIGDMDSVSPKILGKYKSTRIMRFPKKKDYTDSDLALKYAINHFKDIYIFGGVGSRLDHSLNNIFLPLEFLHRDINCTYISGNNIFKIFRDKKIIVRRSKFKYISLVPISKRVTFNYSMGLKYPLDNIELKQGRSIGISNEIIDEKCIIDIKEGVALVLLSRD